MTQTSKTPGLPTPGLCLIADARDDAGWLARCAEALDATSAATLIVRAPDGAAIDAKAASALVVMAQQKGVAALIQDDWRTARTLAADGVHVTARADIDDAYRAARAGLDPGAIVGVDAGSSRHDAMMLGEAGADYVAFARQGEDEDEDAEADHVDLVVWWAQLFVVPVVAFGIETAEQARRMAEARADFIAAPIPPEGDVSAWASGLRAALARDPAATEAAAPGATP